MVERTYEVMRPLTRAELPRWVALADALAENRLPLMGMGCHVMGQLAPTRRGRLASYAVGRIAVAAAATLCLPEPEAFDVVRSAVIPLTDVALDAYEELLREVRPIVHEVVLAERMRRSGSLRTPWQFVFPEGEAPSLENARVQIYGAPPRPVA